MVLREIKASKSAVILELHAVVNDSGSLFEDIGRSLRDRQCR